MKIKLAAKIRADIKKADSFSQQLLQLSRNEFFNKNISSQDYAHFIDLLTCLNLKNQEVAFDIESYINAAKRQKKLKNKYKIDIKA